MVPTTCVVCRSVRTMVIQSCKTKVPKSPIHFFIEQHIACLDISMDNNFLPLLMEIVQPTCNTLNDM
ncbi:hypothetical protein PR202_gb12182 [Eleusine coracana subsp. coracana]|uniref:Uncharacterized protein n=1 Tax=Eleusine coracana subsp. coracana TaxID=191504 RepID=A0AAV5EME3_ELECO|nr:hypothetical protein PR202_gb12182 [Eleusine coracana subsp. coracana]